MPKPQRGDLAIPAALALAQVGGPRPSQAKMDTEEYHFYDILHKNKNIIFMKIHALGMFFEAKLLCYAFVFDLFVFF